MAKPAGLRRREVLALAAAGVAPRPKLDRLRRFAGSFDYNAVLYNPLVGAALFRLLGGTGKRALLEQMVEIRPIRLQDGRLLLQGRPRGAAMDTALLAVALDTAAIEAALLQGEAVLVFSAAPALAAVEPAVLAFAARLAAARRGRIVLLPRPLEEDRPAPAQAG